MGTIVRLISFQKVLTLVMLILLSGCQVMDKSYEILEDLGIKSQPTLNEKINRAISLLENGKNYRAEELIDEVIFVNPDYKMAVTLKKQLQMKPSQFFKTKRFSYYKVKDGDSLAMIAKKSLNSSLHFVSLAKLNNIENPSLLQPGTKIKIPLIATSSIIVKEKNRSKANLKLIESYLAKKDYLKGLEKANTLFIVKQDNDKLLKIQQVLLAALGGSVKTVSDRKKVIAQINTLLVSGRNKSQKKLYGHFVRYHNQQLLLENSISLFADGNYLDAAKKLIKSKQINNTITKQDNYKKLEKQLVDKLHEQAIVFYRNHVLDKALSHWQLIQQIQPDSLLAKKYIQRTEKLIKKLGEY